MICPRCNTNLVITNTHGIEIDFCPGCRGVWLDRGELEKIIERSAGYSSPYSGYNPVNDQHVDYHHDKHRHHDEHHGYGYQTKNKRGFLSDLFDF